MNPDGFISRKSTFDPRETMDRLATAAVDNGMTIFARIDHAAAARQAALTLRPTEVLIFGNPKAGTQLMEEAPTIAIDLPPKVLVWQDADGATWVAYNDPAWLAYRHDVNVRMRSSSNGMEDKLAKLVEIAASDMGNSDWPS